MNNSRGAEPATLWATGYPVQTVCMRGGPERTPVRAPNREPQPRGLLATWRCGTLWVRTIPIDSIFKLSFVVESCVTVGDGQRCGSVFFVVWFSVL